MPDLTLAAVDESDSFALTDITSPVYLTAGAKGLDLPTTVLISDENPYLPGELPRQVRDTTREVFLPVLLSGSTKSELWAARTRLFSMLRPADRLTGARLTAVDPGSGFSRYIDLIYIDGAQGDLEHDQYGQVWQKYGLILRAPRPYWSSTVDSSISWSSSATSDWFPLFPLELAPTQILNEVAVEGATNLVKNPSAEITPSFTAPGWSTLAGGTDPTMAVDTSRSRYGVQCIRFDWPTAAAGGGAGYTADANLTAAVQYTGSVWVWVPTGSPHVQLKAFGIANGTTSTLNDTWQRLTVTWTASTASDYLVVVSASGPTLGQTCYVDGFQIETGATATSYVDGDQPGCHWTGTPHASTSVRDATYSGSTFTVDGDTPTWPVWEIHGPGTALSLVHEGQGTRIDLIGDIPAGTTVTIDTRPRQQSIVDDSGNNLMGRLQPGFSFFSLDPGRNDVSIALSGTGAGSAVTINYTPQWAAV